MLPPRVRSGRWLLWLCLWLSRLHLLVAALASPSAPIRALSKRSQLRYELSDEFEALRGLTSTIRPSENPEKQFELHDLALLSAVDGSILAVRRATGAWAWTLHTDESSASKLLISPLVASQTNVTPAAYSTGLTNASQVEIGAQQEATPDEVYVVEPAAGGAIFLHIKSTGTTQKLPLTVAELVDLSPFTFPSDDSRMFVGKRTTSLVGVDLQSGKLIGVFGPEAGWCEWNGKQGVPKDDECEDGIQTRPRDMLYLGRTGPCRIERLATAKCDQNSNFPSCRNGKEHCCKPSPSLPTTLPPSFPLPNKLLGARRRTNAISKPCTMAPSSASRQGERAWNGLRPLSRRRWLASSI
jgi:hypothetical protein